ncbi:hypothetical protein SUGI_1519540 [Cryptomeria japonica]|uniref:Uncharacterized protein n=1 Tax=Cryptomeria japonica TaxID=3369 RepID=A0AAD3NTP4_CRYJA|nr:hypothetical protein SUGI_1475590 [Cryptomeria japonica]GLJ58959.1 hypothetical protein SUGI_1486240 [Cryptomeria japonica]GLJ59704.1 hypothetical protein SUGI_1519540 [Cryptomeria japonica]
MAGGQGSWLRFSGRVGRFKEGPIGGGPMGGEKLHGRPLFLPWVERDLLAMSMDMHLYIHLGMELQTLDPKLELEMKAMRVSLPTTDYSAGPLVAMMPMGVVLQIPKLPSLLLVVVQPLKPNLLLMLSLDQMQPSLPLVTRTL